VKKGKGLIKESVVICMISLLGMISCSDNNNDTKKELLSEISSFESPIYPKAENIKSFSLKNDLIQGVSYELEVHYPAKEVLNFYEKEMARLGFEPFVEEYYKYGDKVWQTFIDSTREGNPHVAQLLADWVDIQKTKRAKLILRYSWYVEHPSQRLVLTDNNDLKVVFQLMPFFTLPPPVKKDVN
jgi:hypothetical protein